MVVVRKVDRDLCGTWVSIWRYCTLRVLFLLGRVVLFERRTPRLDFLCATSYELMYLFGFYVTSLPCICPSRLRRHWRLTFAVQQIPFGGVTAFEDLREERHWKYRSASRARFQSSIDACARQSCGADYGALMRPTASRSLRKLDPKQHEWEVGGRQRAKVEFGQRFNLSKIGGINATGRQ